METIRFKHTFNKMFFGPTIPIPDQATLLEVFVIDSKELHSKFISYDTTYFDDAMIHKYPIPSGTIMVLLLKSPPYDHIWTTIRRWTAEDFRFYTERIGETFQIEIENKRSVMK